jgi:hypothetical protein
MASAVGFLVAWGLAAILAAQSGNGLCFVDEMDFMDEMDLV